MGNTFASDPTIPDPLAMTTGRDILAASVAPMAELNNWLMAEAGASNFWSQCWPDGISVDSVGEVTVARAYVPVVGSRHTTITALVDCKPNALVSLDLAVRPGAGAVTTIAAGSARAWYRVTATLGAGPGPIVDLLRAAGKGTIYGVSVEVKPLASPLAAGTEDGVEPLGLVSVGASYPLTAHLGRALADNADALTDRPRSLLAWSGVETSASPPASAHSPKLLAGNIGGWSRRHPGLDATYEVTLRVDGAAGSVYVGRAEFVCPGGPAVLTQTVTIPASAQDWEHDFPPDANGLRDFIRPVVGTSDGGTLIDASWGVDGVISDPGVEILGVWVWGD